MWNGKRIPGKYYAKEDVRYEVCLPSKYLTDGELSWKSGVKLKLTLQVPITYEGPLVKNTSVIFTEDGMQSYLTLFVEVADG